ncbi:MAG TPA: DUF1080 domain-containing protein [Bryobacterales bacterium]|nr:DUF1080 domain-containing protein [Bryobacterales bacterium]
MLRVLLAALLASAIAGAAENTLAPQEKKDGWMLLFNGHNLHGWDGDPALWSVKNGVIAGSTDSHPLKHNEFLISTQKYADFILQADIKLRNHNSGIQFRSEVLPEWVCKGYQADAAEGDWWGSLYEERGRGVLVNGWKGKGETVVHADGWNHYEITAHGHHIQLKLNGMVTVDLDDPNGALDGVIALQMHAGKPMEVEFRNIKIKKL